MKTITLVITLLITSTILSQDKYDLFMQKMGVENEVETFVNNYIDKLAANSNGVSTAKWQIIKFKIDYSANYIAIKAVLQKNYTIAEVDDIFAANDMVSPINDTGKLIYKPKHQVRDEMYKVSRTFGKLVNVQIKKLIEES